ncbi:ATP-dependent nuclease [Reichenbachiella sp.]|uniref:ATP-dependent nuclease n=1 Tax=Reichenbachiella sp. TaxID=2184521 RepID=UPI003BAFA447
MIITFEGQHKSLYSFVSEPLKKFTVITGENGCGKSQLMELLAMKAGNNIPALLTITLEPDLKKIQTEGIENPNLSSLNNQNWKSKVDVYVNVFKTIGENGKIFIAYMLEAETWIDKLTLENIFQVINSDIITNDELTTLVTNTLKEFEPNYFNSERQFNQVFARLIQRGYLAGKRKTALVAKYVSNYRERVFHQVSDADFYLTPIPDYFLDEPKLFGSQLEYVFYNYAKRRDQNRRLYFEKKEESDKNSSIPDNEFVEKFIPPWDSINQILESHDIKFRFKGLDKRDFSSDASISFQLVKTTINKDIEFQHLSSGEKVILGLIIKLFTSSYYEERLELPELIILDEPDAHLHPEMSKLLIDVLNDTFVNKMGIYVLMVTHSPSTVALCPDDSIFQLTNEPETTLTQIEKEQALDILTGHLPTLSIDYKNHKQVFVESPTDIYYYQTIFNKLNQVNKYPYRLYFISNSYGKGSCEQVIKIVDDIRSSGNQTSYGIIDWDLKNPESDYVKVHGLDNRYNVENYLYDPIYILILLMNLKAHSVYTELGIDETINQYSLGSESNEFLQAISDWFFTKYYETHKVDEEKQKELVEIEYLNGKKINVPKWYLEFSGHDFEKRIKDVFSAIEGRYRSEGELQKEISLIVGKSFPFIPKDSELLIEKIINSG